MVSRARLNHITHILIMFTILINELPIPVLDITIDHKESTQPLVLFKTTVRADNGTCKIQYNKATLAIGTATLLKRGTSIYTFQLQYTNPTTIPLHYNQAIQMDHQKYYFASQLKTLNV